jgi:hypothetical protein
MVNIVKTYVSQGILLGIVRGRRLTFDLRPPPFLYKATDDGRGTWLYRGLWIGRWRDTMTEEDTNGYEGVFAMTRRNDPLAEM